MDRTHYCGELRKADIDQTVVLYGWVRDTRDLGGCLFLDLRDREGLAQVVFDPSDDAELHARSVALGREFVIRVEGAVRERPNPNPGLPTGEVEIRATALQVLAASDVPPIEVEDEINATEETRLRHRVLDLRRAPMQRALVMRHRANQATRRYLDAKGFLELETPFLARSTPEGARDFLVPSRMHKAACYALPQSPQLFKQLLMVAGYDRYFQIVRCFRDEDLRGERQPEFTQIDIEASFVSPEDMYALTDGLLAAVWKQVLDVELDLPLPRMEYGEAIDRFGSDKPDLRLSGLELHDVSDLFQGSGFKVFESVIEQGGAVRGLAAQGEAATYSRKQVEALEGVVKEHGAAGLAWAKFDAQAGQWSGPTARFIDEARGRALLERLGAAGGAGALLGFCAGKRRRIDPALGALRLHLGRALGLLEDQGFAFTWITEFPLFEWSDENKDWTPSHHPFTQPHPEDLDRLESDPGAVRSLAYDIVCNGSEIGGGSLRIHDSELQARILECLKIPDDEAQEKFGFLLNNLRFGAPPHGGIALGMDRIVAILTGSSSIREVIAFPKTTTGQCLLTEAPSPVGEAQLEELGLRTR